MSTIFALSTPPGKSGVAVIRVSGSKVPEIMQMVFQKPLKPREACLRKLLDPVSRETIDDILALYFKGPASFTGEDILELQIHGGQANISYVLAMLGQIEDVRLAQAGEFSRRAFDNEKIDLTELEGLADLIDAETEAQRRSALAQTQGSHKNLYEGWRRQIVECLALITAAIDFSDEGDLADDIENQALTVLLDVQKSIDEHVRTYHSGEIVRSGFRVALVGEPNAGKSTLMNWLAKRDVAIVSTQPGTTRDVLEVSLDIEGYKIILSDTAGLRETGDEIEREGIRRSRLAIDNAHLVLWLVDSQAYLSGDFGTHLDDSNKPHKILLTKSDLLDQKQRQILENNVSRETILISAKLEDGLERLLMELRDNIVSLISDSEDVLVSRQRYLSELNEASAYLERAKAILGEDIELAAEEMQLAAKHLGRLTGKVDVEDLLDHIFSSFCIGK